MIYNTRLKLCRRSAQNAKIRLMNEQNRDNDALLHEIDKKVAILSTDMDYTKKSVAKIEESVDLVAKQMAGMKFVTPEILTNYIDKHSADHDKINERLEALEDKAETEAKSMMATLRLKFKDWAANAIVILVIGLMLFILMKLIDGSVRIPSVLS
nr:MAG TPA: hypothetical protein [Caudoviricetes sp.]